MAEALVIAVLGAESTGKTTLAQALAAELQRRSGLPATWVPEVLREWCAQRGRTPARHDQAAIAAEQHRRIDAAAATHALVVADTTALMTAVYSRMVFGDASLDAEAVQAHARVSFSLLTACDLPWVADGHQRDGPHVRAPVEALLRDLLQAHALPWAQVHGAGPARLASALRALEPVLAPLLSKVTGAGPLPAERDAAPQRVQFTSDEPGG